jgi:cation:H+ antiporter
MDSLLLLFAGCVGLAIGAELLVRGASRLALTLGVAPIVVGLTVVAFGTSTPELAASIAAQVNGNGGIALSNILGSNIANIGLILALAGLLSPLDIQSVTIRRDVPILLTATLVFVGAMFYFGELTRSFGALLLAGLLAFTLFQIRGAFVEKKSVAEEYQECVDSKGKQWSTATCIIAIIVGLVLLMGGGSLLVDGAVQIATQLGLSERVIGLTIVAIGTSFPELAASIVAVLKKEPDVAIGNVIGSNLFNILGIGGVATLISPISVPAASLSLDVPVLAGATLLACVFFFTGRRLSRIEGGVLLAGYVTYLFVVL